MRRIGKGRAPRCWVDNVEPAAADVVGHDTDEPVLGSGVPREERKGHGIEHLVHVLDLFRPALNDDAPRLSRLRFVSVRLKGDIWAGDRCGEFRALGGPNTIVP